MLSLEDASLARRDTSLPGLARLLDPDAFLAALRTHLPGVDLRGARSTYVRYKPGTNCLSAYQLDVSGEMVDVYAKAHCLNGQGKLSKGSRFPGVSGPLGPGRLVMQDKAIVVSVFPNDKDVRSRSSRQRPSTSAAPDPNGKTRSWSNSSRPMVLRSG